MLFAHKDSKKKYNVERNKQKITNQPQFVAF